MCRTPGPRDIADADVRARGFVDGIDDAALSRGPGVLGVRPRPVNFVDRGLGSDAPWGGGGFFGNPGDPSVGIFADMGR